MSPFWESIAGTAARELVQTAKEEGWVDRITNTFRKKHYVLILGTTGTGKTNLVKSLTNFVPGAIDHMNRTEALKKNRIVIGKSPFVFLDTPGQIGHKSRRQQAIRVALSKNSLLILNVVAYGYHEYRSGTEEVFTQKGTIRKNYLKRHRKMEIATLSEWVQLLGDTQISKGLITCISKADLWWKHSDYRDVLGFYETGMYYKALGPARSLPHSILPYCSVFHKFYGEGFLSGEFDDDDKLAHRMHLLNVLLSIFGKETVYGSNN